MRLSPKISETCRSFDVSVDEFLPEIPERFHRNAAIYFAGSLVEGFGNPTSDLDVMIVSDLSLDDVNYTIEKDLMRINMIPGRVRRIDLEYIHTSVIRDCIDEIAALDIPVDFVAERIDERQELLIHRLLHGLPLFETEAFATLRSAAEKCPFKAYMVKRCLHKIDGAALDLQGMIEMRDPFEVLLRTFEVIDLSIDAFRFSRGMTNPLPKWRIRSLRALTGSPIADEAFEFFLTNRVYRNAITPELAVDPIPYVRDVLYWSDCLMRQLYE
jgi:predicted nucleotidyltransferase